MENIKNEELSAQLENMNMPAIEMPLHKQRLKEALLASAYLEKAKGEQKPVSTPILERIREFMRAAFSGWRVITPAAALLLFFVVYQVFFTPAQAVAYITLQINPALRLVLDDESRVIEAAGLDEEGIELLADLDLHNKEIASAMKDITDTLYAAGFVLPENRIVVAVQSIGAQVLPIGLTALAETAEQAIGDRLAELNLEIQIATVTLTEELAETTEAAGLLPADYADLVVAGASDENIIALTNLQEETGIEQQVFLEEFDTATAAVIDMVEAGISEAVALKVLALAMRADPTLEEMTTITAAVIDLADEGLSGSEALNRVRKAVEADPTLENLYELLEDHEAEYEEEHEEEYQEEVPEEDYEEEYQEEVPEEDYEEAYQEEVPEEDYEEEDQEEVPEEDYEEEDQEEQEAGETEDRKDEDAQLEEDQEENYDEESADDDESEEPDDPADGDTNYEEEKPPEDDDAGDANGNREDEGEDSLEGEEDPPAGEGPPEDEGDDPPERDDPPEEEDPPKGDDPSEGDSSPEEEDDDEESVNGEDEEEESL